MADLAHGADPGAAPWTAEQLWFKCKGCHGMDGKGNTNVGAREKIPDFTLPDWQSLIPYIRRFKAPQTAPCTGFPRPVAEVESDLRGAPQPDETTKSAIEAGEATIPSSSPSATRISGRTFSRWRTSV